MIADGKHRKAASAEAAEDMRLERSGYLGGLPHNFDNWVEFEQFILSTFLFIDTVGAMIFGMGLYKAGFLTNRRPAREYLLLALAGYMLTFSFILIGLWRVYHGFAPLAVTLWMLTPAPIVVPCAVLANASLVLLLAFGPLEWLWRSLTYWKHQPMLLARAR